ncbi:hypothetical protein RF55_20150, partial [Lasius niger]
VAAIQDNARMQDVINRNYQEHLSTRDVISQASIFPRCVDTSTPPSNFIDLQVTAGHYKEPRIWVDPGFGE